MDYQRLIARREVTIKMKISEILKKDYALSAVSKITITYVKLNRSMENALIYYLPFPGEEKKFIDQITPLLSSIHQKLTKSLRAKRCPHIKFIFDKGVDHANRVDQIIKSIHDK